MPRQNKNVAKKKLSLLTIEIDNELFIYFLLDYQFKPPSQLHYIKG